MTAESADDKRIREQASEWVVELAAPHADEAMADAFERWYRADGRHADAFEHASRRFSALAAINDPVLLKLADPGTYRPDALARVKAWWATVSGWRLRWPLAAAVGTVAAVGVAWVVGLSSPAVIGIQDYQTGVAEIRDIALRDGSIVTLGARSRMEVRFEAGARLVTLGDGQAFFSVEKDPNRPFIVQSGDTQVRVTGTKFNLHKGPAGLRVTVEEGVVEVSVQPKLPPAGQVAASATAKPFGREPTETVVPKATLLAGQQIVSSNDGKLENIKQTAATVPPSAWRSGRLIYSNARLAELVADLNRYFDGAITLESAAVGDIRFSGVFSTSDVDRLVENLPQYLPVEVDHQGDKEIIVRLHQTDRPDE